MNNKIFRLVTIIFCASVLSVTIQAGSLSLKHSPEVDGVKIKNENNKTVIYGTVDNQASAHGGWGAHVHVELIDLKGKVIKKVSQTLPPTAPKKNSSRNHRTDYSVSFAPQEISKSSKIKVDYVEHSHDQCSSRRSC